MRRIFFILPVTLLFFFFTNAQSLTGIWEGDRGYSSYYIMPQRIVLELSEYNDSIITGVSHLYYSRGRYEHHKISGRVDKNVSKVYLSEDSIISYKVGLLQTVDEGNYTFKLIKKEDVWILQGNWTSRKKRLFVNPTIYFSFRKEITKEVKIPAENSLSSNNRIDDIQLVLEIDKKERDSIRVDIYDNGEIDNDSISVYVNNVPVISRKQVSTIPITFYLSVRDNNSFDKISMVAENLGDIPPNTALMVITTKKKKYNVFVSSSFEKNAVVEFFLKEK